MRKKSLVNNKYFLIALFVLLIGGISAGFAYLQATLKINGTAKIASPTWNVHFDSVTPAASGNVTLSDGDVAPHIIENTNGTQAEWTVTLSKPGDKYEFSIDVYNAGTLDAKLTGISAPTGYNLGLSDTQDGYLNYSITSTNIDNTGGKLPALPTNDVVTAGTGETLVLKAGKRYTLTFRIEYDANISTVPSAETVSLGYKLDFIQDGVQQ